jgi:hypothetical protein
MPVRWRLRITVPVLALAQNPRAILVDGVANNVALHVCLGVSAFASA